MSKACVVSVATCNRNSSQEKVIRSVFVPFHLASTINDSFILDFGIIESHNKLMVGLTQKFKSYQPKLPFVHKQCKLGNKDKSDHIRSSDCCCFFLFI